MSKWLKEMRIQYNKFDTEKFIKKSIQIWKNKYDYSKTEYIESNNNMQRTWRIRTIAFKSL